ncbi:alpha-L-fucosidase, partial [Desulfonatronum sp. SC1]
LDIGPKEDGSIPEEQLAILKEFARWTGKHSEAIYGTRAGMPEGHFPGLSAVSKDQKTLFLYIDYAPNHPLTIRGVRSKVKGARVVGCDTKLTYKTDRKSGDLTIEVPKSVIDPMVTVIALDLSKPLELGEVAVSHSLK